MDGETDIILDEHTEQGELFSCVFLGVRGKRETGVGERGAPETRDGRGPARLAFHISPQRPHAYPRTPGHEKRTKPVLAFT